MSKFINPKIRTYLSNLNKEGEAHAQYMNSHYAKFEYQEMNTLGVTDYKKKQKPS